VDLEFIGLIRERVRNWVFNQNIQICHMLKHSGQLDDKDVVVRLKEYYEQEGAVRKNVELILELNF
jgi:hypothetical protein